MFPDHSAPIDSSSMSPRSNASGSQSPQNSPRVKGAKPKGKTKAADANARLHVKAPTDDRNVWIYGSALKSIDLATASREAAASRAAASSVQLVDGSVGDDATTLVTVRLPDSQTTTFRVMRSACLAELHAATAAAFSIESEFVFSLSYPHKLLLQQNVLLEELGLIPTGLLCVIFSDERDSHRKSPDRRTATAKGVGLPNILEMELKEQQNITKSVQSHIITHHPKVANLVADANYASSAKHKAARSTASAAGDDVSVLLTAVDGLFLKTNVELQTISNSRQPDLPRDAMKKMVRMEAAHEQRHLNREQEKQQYQQHVKRLDLINAGTTSPRAPLLVCFSPLPRRSKPSPLPPPPSFTGVSRATVHRASSELLYVPASFPQCFVVTISTCTKLEIDPFNPTQMHQRKALACQKTPHQQPVSVPVKKLAPLPPKTIERAAAAACALSWALSTTDRRWKRLKLFNRAPREFRGKSTLKLSWAASTRSTPQKRTRSCSAGSANYFRRDIAPI